MATQYSGVVYHWATGGINQIRLDRKTVSDLVEILNWVFTLYTENDILANKIEEIRGAISKLTGEGQQTSLFFHMEAVEGKLRRALGLSEEGWRRVIDEFLSREVGLPEISVETYRLLSTEPPLTQRRVGT